MSGALPESRLSQLARSAAYCFMNAERNKAEGVRRREAKAKHMEALDLESVIERARGHDAEALGNSIAAMSGRVFGLCRYMFEQRPELRALILSKLV
jgi:hypothetical protein